MSLGGVGYFQARAWVDTGNEALVLRDAQAAARLVFEQLALVASASQSS